MSTRPYVGIEADRGHRATFRAAVTPTEATHGNLYVAVIGPFRTMRAARLMAECGGNNPHLRCVADAERMVEGERA